MISQNAINWLANGERGLSSNAIFMHLTGVNAFPPRSAAWGTKSHPHDPDDLRRCVLLLHAVPELREDFERMRTLSPTWDRLVDAWPRLETLLLEEMQQGNSAPKTYDAMRAVLRDDAQSAQRQP